MLKWSTEEERILEESFPQQEGDEEKPETREKMTQLLPGRSWGAILKRATDYYLVGKYPGDICSTCGRQLPKRCFKSSGSWKIFEWCKDCRQDYIHLCHYLVHWEKYEVNQAKSIVSKLSKLERDKLGKIAEVNRCEDMEEEMEKDEILNYHSYHRKRRYR